MIIDPFYGELLTAREVSELSGFTMNQMRNWRLPSRLDRAPFGFLSIGKAPYYSKVVVDSWLDIHGGQTPTYHASAFDRDFVETLKLQQEAEDISDV